MTRASVFTQNWEGGAPGLCPPSIRVEMAGAAPVSHCHLLTILKVLRNKVGVFRSLPATQGREHRELATQKSRGMVLGASAEWLPENGCHGEGCPFGDRAVAPQSNNPLLGLLSLVSAARTLCQCQSWSLCWTATVGHQDWVGATKKHMCGCVSGPGCLQCEAQRAFQSQRLGVVSLDHGSHGNSPPSAMADAVHCCCLPVLVTLELAMETC